VNALLLIALLWNIIFSFVLNKVDFHVHASLRYRLSTNSFEMSPVSLLPPKSAAYDDVESGTGSNRNGRGRRQLQCVLFAVTNGPTTVAPNSSSPEYDARRPSEAEPNISGDYYRKDSTAFGRPSGEYLLRTARKSISKINVYLSSRLPAMGGLMYGRRDRSATKRERKATKTLAIVLGMRVGGIRPCRFDSVGIWIDGRCDIVRRGVGICGYLFRDIDFRVL
jgi:hypothetical protein